MPEHPTAFQTHGRIRLALAAILAAAIIRLWILPVVHSFRVDETLIVWTIRNGFAQIVSNAQISLQSIAFCWLEWLVSRLFGVNEVSLRLLPVLASIASLYVYYRIGAEFIDREAGVFFAVLYLSLQTVAFQTPNARPYSLALWAEAAALLWLLRWLRSGRILAGLLWIACSAVACHLHYLFVIPMALESAYVLWRALRRPIPLRQILAGAFLAVVLLLPAVPQALTMSRQATLLSFAATPTLVALVDAIAPLYLVGPAALFALVVLTQGQSVRWRGVQANSGVVTLGALLLLLPAFGLFALSRFTTVRLFQERYLLPAAPGFVLLWGGVLRALEPPFFRRLSVASALVVSLVLLGRGSVFPNYRPEDWRSAVRSMPDSGAVLLYSGLVEARRLDWLEDPARWGYLMAPVLAYRSSTTRENGFPLPFEFGAAEQAYQARMLEGPLRDRDTITVIVLRSFWGPAWLDWISERLSGAGFRPVSHVQFTNVEIAVFHRAAIAASAGGRNVASPGRN